jgi:hypothetical protein
MKGCKANVAMVMGDYIQCGFSEPCPRHADKSITCPKCHRTSWNKNDVEQRYCGACHQFHSQMEGNETELDYFGEPIVVKHISMTEMTAEEIHTVLCPGGDKHVPGACEPFTKVIDILLANEVKS